MKIAHKFVLLLQFGVVSALFGQPTQNTDFSVGVEVLGVEGFYLSPGVLASYRASSLLELGAGYYSSKRTLFRPETNLLFQSDAVDEYNNNSARAFANLYPLDIPLYANVAYGVLPSRSVGGTFVLTDLPAIQQISLLLQRGREEQKGTILVLKTQRKILDLYISSSAAYRNL